MSRESREEKKCQLLHSVYFGFHLHFCVFRGSWCLQHNLQKGMEEELDAGESALDELTQIKTEDVHPPSAGSHPTGSGREVVATDGGSGAFGSSFVPAISPQQFPW